MTDDLLERLSRYSKPGRGDNHPQAVACREAKDRIEALTAESARLRGTLERIASYLSEPAGEADEEDTMNSLRGDLRFVARTTRAALNTGKEVMPDGTRKVPNNDIGPGDQGAVAGAARDAILHGLGLMLDGKHVPVREFYAFPQGLFHLTGDTLGLRCATNGCGQHVSVRLERDGVSTDYCEPCGLKAVRT